jgi:hypothetical protein
MQLLNGYCIITRTAAKEYSLRNLEKWNNWILDWSEINQTIYCSETMSIQKFTIPSYQSCHKHKQAQKNSMLFYKIPKKAHWYR